MPRLLRPYVNAFLLGFIVTFIAFLFLRFNASDVVLGVVIGAMGGALALVLYGYLNRKFGTPAVLYDKDGNPVRR